MENFDLTKLTGSELRELSTKISKEIVARKNFRKDELLRAIIQSIKAYTVEFGELKVEIKDYNCFYFTNGDKYDFYPDKNKIVLS